MRCEDNLKKILEEKNPQLVLFRALETFLGEEIRPFIVDMKWERSYLWIKVTHPAVSQLLLWQKTAIMSEIRELQVPLQVKGLRVLVVSSPLVEDHSQEEKPLEISYAPTGDVVGDVVPMENEKLRELMDALRRKIQEREGNR